MKVTFTGLTPSKILSQILNSLVSRASLTITRLESEEAVEKFLIRYQDSPHIICIIVIPDQTFHSLEHSGFWNLNTLPCFMFLESCWESSIIAYLDLIMSHLNYRLDVTDLRDRFDSLNQKTETFISQFENHLALATQIHRSLHPYHPLAIPGLRVLTKYLPAAGLGGDYFDVFDFFNHKQLGILIADSPSHNMAAALLTSLMKTPLEPLKQESSFSKHVIEALNQEVYQANQNKTPGINFLFGILDRASLHFDFTTCGEITFLWGQDNQFKEPNIPKNPALGASLPTSFNSSSLQLAPGNRLFFTSDGLAKTLSLPREHLAKLLTSFGFTDLLDQQTELLALVNGSRQGTSEPEDDITLIQVEIDPNALYVTQSK